ncbi:MULTISPECIES: GntR family transcriptional regulator [Carnobacterium]|uniref:GntR family transcriptional regulator n=2 Tax=Carnobacterium TaxID=2747 RepID=UPI001F359AD0|nr:GntR family transcriptional regulator [Carnobacterium maltaromaticum]
MMDDYIKEMIKTTDSNQYLPLNEIVYNGLRKAIIDDKVPIGVRINEKEYADRMNISRTPVREALKRLEAEDLVEYIPRFGVIVKKINQADITEIYQIRFALDVLATGNAIPIMTDKQFNEMEALLELTEEKNRNGDIDGVIELFTAFNTTIYNNAKMPRLISILAKLQEYLLRFRDISIRGEARRRKALDEHWLIFRAMKNKDPEQAAMIIEEHLSYSMQFIIDDMQKSNG